MQLYTFYYVFVNRSFYTFRVITPPIIKSTHNCNHSIWHWSKRLRYLPLSWSSWNSWNSCSTTADVSGDVLTSARCCDYSYVCSWWWVELSPETCRTSGLQKHNKMCMVASRWTIIHTFCSFLNVALKLSSQPMKVACLVLASSIQIIFSTSWSLRHLVSFIVLWLTSYKLGRSFRISAVEGSSVLGSSSRSSHLSPNLLTIESHVYDTELHLHKGIQILFVSVTFFQSLKRNLMFTRSSATKKIKMNTRGCHVWKTVLGHSTWYSLIPPLQSMK